MLARKTYRAPSDHDHCEFCWAKFVDPARSEAHARMVRDDPEILTEGFAVIGGGPNGENDYRWICKECADDFREHFEWRIIETTG